MDPNSAPVRRIVQSFGSIDAAAEAINNINHGIGNYTNGQKTLLARAVNHCKQYQGIDLNALKTQVDQMSQQVIQNSPEEAIKQTLHRLNKKYKIDINEIHRIGSKINTLSEAATDAAVTIQRQIRQLEKQQGNNTEGKRLEGVLNQLMKELANKKYYSGVLNFLSEAQTQISEIDNMLSSIPQTGTELEKAFETARVLQNIKSLKEQYYTLVSALADEHLTIDESIGQTDVDNIRQSAKDLKEYFDKKEKVLDNLTESTMISLMTQIIGDSAPNGQAMINVIRMAAADSSIMDYLYSVGRASNPIIAAMGTIIRNAQDSRDDIMNNMSLRIRRATDKLYKSGSDSSFMYEDDGHIISDIDWKLYKAARTAHIKDLYRQGLRGFDLKQAIEDWEEVNTEDRVVDNTNGRTERVPDSQYRKPFPQLTQAQQEYYDEIQDYRYACPCRMTHNKANEGKTCEYCGGKVEWIDKKMIFTHSIPVFTTHLRPTDITSDGFMYYEPVNGMYNMINRHVHLINRDKRKYDQDEKIKNSELFQTQMKYMELVTEIMNILTGKKGQLRSLLAGQISA
jgi:hypothetical protein